jgi:DnaJ domain
MSTAAGASGPPQRPEFMAVLGLLPPYTLEDVREAYRQKALAAHPDRGGDAAEFNRLSEAYDRATEYVALHGDRRAWIAAQVECHLAQEEVAAEVKRRGGDVEYERMAWVKATWGEGFELLADRLRGIRVRGMTDGDAFLAKLPGRDLPYLSGMDLANSRVSDAGLRHLRTLSVLQWLDLSGSDVTYAGLRHLLERCPSLTYVNVKGTRVGWLRRRLLARQHPRVSIVATAPGGPQFTARIPLVVPP